VVAAYQQVADWAASAQGQPVAELTYAALRFLGHLRLSLAPSAADLERLAAVRLLQDAAAGAPSVEALLDAGNTLIAPAIGDVDAVTIMTIHAAKGLQFKVVFVPAMAEGRFPVAVDADPVFYLAEAIRDWVTDPGAVHARTGTERLAQHIREERRLAYVALTRAEEELVVSRALVYGGEPAQPSRFLAEMGAPAPVLVAGRAGDAASQARAYLLQAAAGIRRADEAGVAGAAAVLRAAEAGGVPLRRQVDPVPFGGTDSLRLSASAIEMYRDCPRKYYYAYVLRLPDEDNVYTAFGSALHAALERFNLARMGGEFPAWPTVAAMWDEAMQPAAFVSSAQFRQLKARGQRFLQRFYDWAAVAPRQVVETEGKFQFDYVDGKGRTHVIRGRYDLIERDTAGNEEIIDYKSGTRESTGVTKGVRMTEKHPQKKLQLGLYYLARHGGQVVPGARVSYIFLKHEADKPPLVWAPAFDPGEQAVACEHTAETLQGISGIIDGVIDGILANEFTRNAEERKCGMCAFRDACEVGRRAYF
ncbi:MAG: UvrD/REP helicase, partial [Firmicutes bacterium]|nr:UvrD/REP helicase [Bacillota bacterium]